MKALTIWQPWATLIMAGAKPYEFRSWAAPKAMVGQRIAIHAGARPIRRLEVNDLLERLESDDAWSCALRAEKALPILERAWKEPQTLPLASVLGTAVLGEPVRSTEILAEFDAPAEYLNDSDREEHCNWAWPLGDVQPLEPIVPAKGMQGFWCWDGA